MTRERLKQIREEWGGALTSDALLLMWGETITALEQAWIERDVNAMELEATISERDEARKDSEAWAQWAYTLGLSLDWFTPAIGVDNRERIVKAVRALKTVTVERDEAITVKNNLCQQNTELLEDVAAMTLERDAAIMEGNALTIEKDGMQILIDDLRKGHDRYETARRLSPTQWADVWKLNISTGKPFDEIIDDLRPFVRPIHDSD